MKKSDVSFTPHQEKVIQLDDHIALTANAGSGKTFVLKYKYLHAAKKLKGDVSRIAAITFTNKAANELYKKISELVDEEISLTKDKSELQILYKIRRGLVSANISTIHSFCVNLLKNYPVEAGVDANFTPINQVTANELVELSIQETIESLFNDEQKSELIKDLIRYFGSRYKLEEELKKLLYDKKNVLLLKEKIYDKSELDLNSHFNQITHNLITEIKNIFSDNFVNLLEKINSVVLQNIDNNVNALEIKDILADYKKNQDFISLLKNVNRTVFTTSGEIRVQGYFPKKLKENYSKDISQIENNFKRLKPLLEFDLGSNSHKELISIGKKIISLFDEVFNTYEDKKRKNSYIDFNDILIKTKQLLKKEDVRKQLSSKIDYLMVDEYQDTDETQYEIFLPILDDLKNGKLFIVGDDKQSIYRFRDAELSVFEKTKNDILKANTESGLQLLPDSFRMVKELCLFTNYVFDRLFDVPISLFNEVKNVPIICAKSEQEEGEIQFLCSSGGQIDNCSDDYSLPELIANKILEIVGNFNYTFSQIAILTTKRKHFDEIENVFIHKRIPYKIVGGRGFYQRQVVSDIKNYLSFISNPNDDLHLIAILRSPFFMISDSEIFKINLLEEKTFFEKLKKYSLINNRYLDVIQTLNDHIALCSSLPTSILIRKILSDTDLLMIIKNRHNGQQEIANIEKVLSIAREFDSLGFKNLYDFVNHLNEAQINIPDEAQAEGLLSDSGVQLMTIHQAKGLEFPIVFLYRCETSPEISKTKAKDITVNKDIGLLFKVKQDFDPSTDFIIPPIVALNDFIELGKELAEIKRLLYVGITRAINKLFITFQSNEKDTYSQKSFIGLLKQTLQIVPNQTIKISDNLTFLVKKDNEYYNLTKKIEVEIRSLTSSIKDENINVHLIQSENNKKYFLNTPQLYAEKNLEIISATKISVYEKCPLKYHLTYNIGLAKLLHLLPKEINPRVKNQIIAYLDDETNNNGSDDTSIEKYIFNKEFNSIRFGQIIHKILEKNISVNKISEFLLKQDFIKTEDYLNQESKKIIIDMIEKYYASDVYKQISGYDDYKNEFEIIVKEDNVILKGIVDKIIFKDNSILIIDYKTDLIDKSITEKLFDNYQIQMKFYLYISMKIFENYEQFSAKLIFLRNPELTFELNYGWGNFEELREELFKLVKGISEDKIVKNLNHCDHCIYSLDNNNCIIK